MKRIKVHDLPKHYQQQLFENLGDHPPVRHTDKKRDGQAVLSHADESTAFTSPVHIIVSVWRIRGNWDADNIETKGLIDGLVKCGIIADDTIKEVPAVTKKGYRCKTRDEEKTIIEIIEIEPASGNRGPHCRLLSTLRSSFAT